MKKLVLTLAMMLTIFISQAENKAPERRGDMYFKAACYPRAFNEYMRDYAKTPDDPQLLRRIVETILYDESPRDTAVFFIEKYLNIVPDDVEAYYLAAQAHYHAHNFAKAQKYLEEYSTMSNNQKTQAKADQLQSWITNAQRMMKDTLKCALFNLGEMINTPSAEINPYISPDDKTLFFSCDEKYNSTAIIKYFNIKFSENVDLSWSKSKTIGGQINTLYDEYVSGLTKDWLFYCSNIDIDFGLNQARIKGGGRCDDGEKMDYPIDTKGDEIAATLTAGGDTIIFSATTTGGKLSLFYSIKFKGEWAEARPLPGKINSELSDESYPNLSRDGKRLYFASNREGSMGGYDLFYSVLDEKTWEWGEPIQLKYPINDTYDNLTISFSSTGRYAYISSIRKEGFGNRDIYAVIFDNVLPTAAILKCFVGIRERQRPRPLTTPPFIEVRDEEDDEVIAHAKLNMETSTFILALDPGVYTLHIVSSEGLPLIEQIVVDEKVYDQVAIEKIFQLEPNAEQ